MILKRFPFSVLYTFADNHRRIINIGETSKCYELKIYYLRLCTMQMLLLQQQEKKLGI